LTENDDDSWPFRILLVEDHTPDAIAIQRLADQVEIPVSLQIAPDGESALAYLLITQEAEEAEERPMPHLVLLDIGLPRTSGIEVLRLVKGEQRLEDVPVVILSGTDDAQLVRQGKELGAYTQIPKPLSSTEFGWMVKSIRNYWARLANICIGLEEAA
jgi:CheY-like chemotaxis protein